MSLKLVDTNISQLVREVSRKMDTILFPISDEYNLTNMKYKVLQEINKKNTANIGEIGQALGIADGNISNMCKKLEKEGYLKRTRSIEDERIVTVTLTDKGIEAVKNVKDELEKKYKNCKEDLTDEELEQIIYSFVILNKHLDNLASFE
ncbi:MarR family winged helix-turn-helix transcriptional regulator [Miniphocaeibacter halophilus]|uniref:MarR family transcriptional regulator n=1 Tax=Miniphocaeibacter halophilus TaxID=2931922 RepID=A0AC61MRP1_9FIRM|nr:MarR family transcriptional regulator [Miniphocaeibacter halophilus]QQK08227.1 MarR family transcriptional regulator [Miniphocaeibacter halophilus]